MANEKLNEGLKDVLLSKVSGEKEAELKGMIEKYHDKFADGSISKAEVAAISFKIAGCLDQQACEDAAKWIKDLFIKEK